jgi:hypothetical protein
MNKYSRNIVKLSKNKSKISPNGKRKPFQKGVHQGYFDGWLEFVKVCPNCDTTIIEDDFDYQKVNDNVVCDGCGSTSQFNTSRMSSKRTEYSFEEEILIKISTEPKTTFIKTTENNKMSDETTTEVDETMEYNESDLPDSVLALRKELTEKNTALEKGIKEKKKTIANARKKIKANDAEITRITKEAKSREERIIKEKAVEWMKANQPDVFKSLSDN